MGLLVRSTVRAFAYRPAARHLCFPAFRPWGASLASPIRALPSLDWASLPAAGRLQTPPRDDALALLLPSCLRAARKQVGSTITWHEDSHLVRSGPCLAHIEISRRVHEVGWIGLLRPGIYRIPKQKKKGSGLQNKRKTRKTRKSKKKQEKGVRSTPCTTPSSPQ
jgi:hypothetical protein